MMKDDFVNNGMKVVTPAGKQYSCGFTLDEGKPGNGFLKLDHIIATKNLR